MRSKACGLFALGESQGGFDSFEKNHKLLTMHIAKDGRYEFSRETASANRH